MFLLGCTTVLIGGLNGDRAGVGNVNLTFAGQAHTLHINILPDVPEAESKGTSQPGKDTPGCKRGSVREVV